MSNTLEGLEAIQDSHRCEPINVRVAGQFPEVETDPANLSSAVRWKLSSDTP